MRNNLGIHIMINRFEKFICDITEIDLYWHRLATSVMKEYDLKGNYAVYFTILNNSPEGLTSAELSTICGKDKADISRDINALEKSGYVKKVKNGDSSYRAKIVLTDKGTDMTRNINTQVKTAVSCIGGNLDDKEREIFYRVLDEIKDNMMRLSETGIPKNK